MIDGSTIYWITRLDYLRTFITIIAVVSAVLTLVAIIGYAEDSCKRAYSDEEKAEKKTCLFRWSLFGSITLALFLLFFSSLVFVPTTKEMCAIKIIPAVANCEQVQNLGSDVVDLARSWMDELKPETVKSRETKK